MYKKRLNIDAQIARNNAWTNVWLSCAVGVLVAVPFLLLINILYDIILLVAMNSPLVYISLTIHTSLFVFIAVLCLLIHRSSKVEDKLNSRKEILYSTDERVSKQ